MSAPLVLVAALAASPHPLGFGLAAAAPAPPQVVVVHDGALAEAQAVTAHLSASGKVLATLREAPLAASCVRTTACPERPKADALVAVAVTGSSVHIELVDNTGATRASEVVAVGDPALLDATLAPALDRIEDAAVAGATPDAAPATPPPDAQSPWVPWVLGTGVVCGGLCLLGAAAGVVYAMIASAQAAGDAAGNACGDALTNACTAPFNALGDACASVADIGNACSGLGDSCSSAGDACSGVGDIGACAVMPNAPAEPGDPRPVMSAAPSTGRASAMRY